MTVHATAGRRRATFAAGIGAVALAAAGAGCASGPARASTARTARADVPAVALMDESRATQRKDDVAIQVAAAEYGIEERTSIAVSRQQQPTFAFPPRENMIYVESRTELTLAVEPDHLELVVTLTNQGARVLRPRGVVVELSVNGKALALDAERSYSGFTNATVPPGRSEQFRIVGPRIDEIAVGSVIGLYLYDMPIVRDGAGNVTEVENFEWHFSYGVDPVERQLASVVERGFMDIADYEEARRTEEEARPPTARR